MALIATLVNDPLLDMERTMDGMFDRGMDRWLFVPVAAPQQQKQQQQQLRRTAGRDAALLPEPRPAGHPFDIIEKADAYELVADAPGFDTDDITVQLLDKMLTISGNKKQQPQPQQAARQEGKVLRCERHAHHFRRSFVLPDNVNPDGIVAKLDRGVLTVSIPKMPEPEKPQPRQIAVQSAAA